MILVTTRESKGERADLTAHRRSLPSRSSGIRGERNRCLSDSARWLWARCAANLPAPVRRLARVDSTYQTSITALSLHEFRLRAPGLLYSRQIAPKAFYRLKTEDCHGCLLPVNTLSASGTNSEFSAPAAGSRKAGSRMPCRFSVVVQHHAFSTPNP